MIFKQLQKIKYSSGGLRSKVNFEEKNSNFVKKVLQKRFCCDIIYRLMEISKNITHTPFNNGVFTQVSSNTVG